MDGYMNFPNRLFSCIIIPKSLLIELFSQDVENKIQTTKHKLLTQKGKIKWQKNHLKERAARNRHESSI